MATETFHIGDIISITDGKLVARGHVAAVQRLLSFMVGEPVFTHQLPRVATECEGSLREQHPDIGAIVVPDWSDVSRDDIEATVMGWLDEQVAVYGAYRDVMPLSESDHTSIDPLSEFAMVAPDVPVVPVVADGDPA